MTPFGIATIASSAGPELAVLSDEGVLPLRALLPGTPGSLRQMLANWDHWCDDIAECLPRTRGGWLDVDQVAFLPPVPDPPTIYCVGANYRDHALEMSDDDPYQSDEPPYFFLAPPSALSGHRQPVVRPKSVTMLDWEVELTAVIGRPARHLDPGEALSCVAGYTVANDVSVRDPGLVRDRIFGMRWLAAKGFESFLPMGPAVVPAQFVPDPMNLELSLTINGDVRQHSSTKQMIAGLPEQIAHLSSITTLLPGDLVLTGTPAGTAAAHGTFLANGDHMTAWVEGVGSLDNRIVAE